MTTAEFKKAYPEYAHLEGDELWDTMTEMALITQQIAREELRTKPFWKRYRLRWLFYRRSKGWDMGLGAQYKQSQRCASCKNGVGMCIGWSGPDGSFYNCPKCGKSLLLEPNTSLDHRAWKAWQRVTGAVFWALDWLHILRSNSSRYGVGGDEMRHVAHYVCGKKPREAHVLKPRKWYEHIFTEK